MILDLLASLARLDEADLAHVLGGLGPGPGTGTTDPEPAPWRTGVTTHT